MVEGESKRYAKERESIQTVWRSCTRYVYIERIV